MPRWLKKAKTEPVLVLGVYFLLSLVGYRGIVFRSGMPGHSVDWTIPASAEALADYAKDSLSLWWDQFLGSFGFYQASSLFQFIGAFPGLLGIPGWAVAKIWLVIVPPISGYFIYLLVKDILEGKSRFFPFLAGLFFAFGPLRFNLSMSGGFFSFQLAYMFLPLGLMHFRRLLAKPSIRNALLFAISSFFVTANLQLLIFYGLILICLVPLLLRTQKLAFCKSLGVAAGVLILLVAPAIVVFFSILFRYNPGLSSNLLEVSGSELIETLKSKHVAIPFVEALTTTGYSLDFYSRAASPWGIFNFLASLLSSIVIVTTLFYEKKEPLLYLGLYLLFAVFASAGMAPGSLKSMILYLYEYFEPMVLFRSPVYFLFPVHLLFSILLGVCLYRNSTVVIQLLPKLKRQRLAVYFAYSVLPLALVAPLFVPGNLAGLLDMFEDPPYYQEIVEPMRSDGEDYRIAFVPVGRIPEFLETRYQHQGGPAEDPLIIFSPKSTLDVNRTYLKWSDEFQMLSERILYSEHAVAQNPLYLSSVRYVVARKDVLPNRWYPNSHLYKWDKVIAGLDSNRHFKRVALYDQATIYELDRWLPRVKAYAPNKAVVTSSWQDFKSIVYNPHYDPFSTLIVMAYDLPEDKLEQISSLVTSSGPRHQFFRWEPDGNFEIHNVGQGQIEARIRRSDQGIITIVTSEGDKANWNVTYYNEVQDFSKMRALVVPWDGAGSGAKVTIVLQSIEVGQHWFEYSFYDNFTGWREIVMAKELFEAKGDPSWSNIVMVDVILNLPNIIGHWRIGPISYLQITADVPNLPEVSYTHPSSTNYQIEIKGAEKPFILVVSETYYPLWKATIRQGHGSRVVTEDWHFVANGYANAWYIDQSGDFEVVVEFTLQRWFQRGAVISIVSLMGVASYLAVTGREKDV